MIDSKLPSTSKNRWYSE